MSVDLEIKLKHLPREKRKYFNFEETCKEVMRKYPIMKIEGSILFGNARKCDISFDKGVIYFGTNAALYDYMNYAAYAFADVLGIEVVNDDQEGREIPISELSELLGKVPKMLEEERRRGLLPVIYKLKPKKGKFRLLQIEKAFEKINQKHGKDIVVYNRLEGYVLLSDKTKENLTIFYERDLSEIEVEKPEKETDRFEKVLSELVNELDAEVHKEE